MSVLREEIRRLAIRGERARRWKSQAARNFHERGGVCCPACGVENYSGVMSKQERRLKQATYLIEKIKRDGGQFDDAEKRRVLATFY
jgi:hypothetical protein